ncbi:hypothetical protein OV079_01345 [Nannocystis pusilla]|uniref:Uncharacterized protein n=1 Tax=Nannocystis pusilla TaxID=889268 RepID=A0A9X3EHL9_9BACT|nr:hypothetical protein [Nannocystis pusilla]MCY1004234.1 hypothetical protein [Nannocystis pusilla]
MGACTISKLSQDETSSGEGDSSESVSTSLGEGTAGESTTSAGEGTASAGSTSAGEGTTGAGSTSVGTTSAGEGSTSAGEGTTSAGEGTTSAGTTSAGSGGPEELPEGCVGLDHETCFGEMVDACAGQGNWNVTQACVDAVASCYPIGAPVLAPSDVVSFCSAEVSHECLFEGGPGCGETFCTCTAGGYPFDWDNCWHLLLLGCYPGVGSDCEAALAGCYPGVSVEELSACQDQVMDTVGHECNCPMCSIHEQCEDALELCLGV